jgi:hypothetical protein
MTLLKKTKFQLQINKEQTCKSQVWNNLFVACQYFLKTMARWMITVKAKHLLIMSGGYVNK